MQRREEAILKEQVITTHIVVKVIDSLSFHCFMRFLGVELVNDMRKREEEAWAWF